MYISNENCIHVVVVCRTFQNKHRCLPIVFLKKKIQIQAKLKEKKELMLLPTKTKQVIHAFKYKY